MNPLLSLQGVKKYSDYWMARCPCHDDKTPSLKVRQVQGEWYFDCFAGCDWQDIKRVLGYDKDPLKVNQVQREYRYHNEKGEHVYTIKRFPGKDFRAFAPDDSPGLKGAELVPYQLHRWVDKKSVIVVEGEKDVHTVEKLGLPATTTPFGSSAWSRGAYSQWFQGKRVAIIPDNDEAGRKYAEEVKQSLSGVADFVRIVNLDVPHKGDVSDWVQGRENAREELLALIKGTKIDVPGLVKISDVQTKPVEYLWYPYIPLDKLTIIDGDPGIGKSWLSLAISTGVSLGMGIPGAHLDRPENVLLLSTEDGAEDTIKPRLEAMGADLSKIFVFGELFSFNESGIEKLRSLMETTKPRVVFIDPILAYFGMKTDMNKASDTRPLLTHLKELGEKFHCALVGIRHMSKDSKGKKAIYQGLGSIDIVAAARSVMKVEEYSDETEKIRYQKIVNCFHVKCNVAKRGQPIQYELTETSPRNAEFYWLVDGERWKPNGEVSLSQLQKMGEEVPFA